MKNFNSILYIYSNMDSSSQILLFLIVLVSLMLFSIFIINIITKKKNNSKIVESNHTLNMNNISKEEIVEELSDEIKPTISLKTIENKASVNVNENIEFKDKKEDVKEEVSYIVSKKTSIEEIAKLIENTLEQEPIDLTKFEEDQEENAIISYDELVKRAGAKKIVYKCEEDNDILESSLKTEDKKQSNISEIDNSSKSKFQASKIISPVFGIQNQKEEHDENIESFIDLEPIKMNNSNSNEDEMQKDMEFLGSLKQFRSELE